MEAAWKPLDPLSTGLVPIQNRAPHCHSGGWKVREVRFFRHPIGLGSQRAKESLVASPFPEEQGIEGADARQLPEEWVKRIGEFTPRSTRLGRVGKLLQQTIYPIAAH